jgi:hypothetical protein
MDLIRRASLRKAALRLRVCLVYFATRKQGVEESRRFETPLAVIFVTIESKTVIKYLLLVVSPKAFFKVLASAMAISHYAAVFFCAQRNRVTLAAQRVSAIAFAKTVADINIATGRQGFGTKISCMRQNRTREKFQCWETV